ncbi:probable glutathione S-transferase [Salvia miltiorrhiza]|uniref:probable glutathione S-transferase n=1 Tax=Salvia miltiorrhiza TaxID=226208 RepID=UPI0025AD67BA|nr:probable glutathione S-transferase [Salvia miltiorrhiza]
MGEVKVIGGWFSPFVKRVEMALKMKGVEYEYIEVDVVNKSPLLLQHNPIHKKVPVLLHDGKSIVESAVILEYIDEVWEGPNILPKDPYERAMARFWANFIDEKCAPATRKALWSRGEEREKAVEEATQGLKILESEVKGKKFFGGDQIGYVDIIGCFLAYWFPIVDQVVGLHLFTQDKFPSLCKWADELCDNEFIKECLPDKERLVDRVRGHSQAPRSL